MTSETYESLSSWWRTPDRTQVLRAANKALTMVGYVAYPTLLVALIISAPDLLLRAIAVPGVSFVLVSLVRRGLNMPRPYEVLDIRPLIAKDTRGKSMPSRHTFCMFMIACSWFLLSPAIGAVLLVFGTIMACLRVIGGVHFPRDVVAGALSAIACATLGYLVIPW